MSRKFRCWGLSLLLVALAAGPLLAGPFDGSGCFGRNCPPSEYPLLNYWAPNLYRVRAWVHPSYLNQYAPGPSPGVPPTYNALRYPCPSIPPTPSPAYADPEAYYGRPLVTPR